MSAPCDDPVICFKVACLVKADIPTFIVPTRISSSLTLGRFAADIVERCNKKLQSAFASKGIGKGSTITVSDISSLEISQSSVKDGSGRGLSPLLLDLVVNEQDPLRYFLPPDALLGAEHLSVTLHPVEPPYGAVLGHRPFSSNASDNSSDGGDGASSRKSPVAPVVGQGFVPKPPKRLDADTLAEDGGDGAAISSTSFRSRRVKRYTESAESNSTPWVSESSCRSPLAKRPPSMDPVAPRSPSPVAVASLSTEARGSLSPYSPPARLHCNVPIESENGAAEDAPRPRTVSRFHSLVSSAAEFAAHENIRLSRQTAEQVESHNSHISLTAVEKLEELRTRYKEVRFALCTEERKSRRMLRTQFLVPFADAPREVQENVETERDTDFAFTELQSAESLNRKCIVSEEAETRQRIESEHFVEWKRCLLRRETQFNKEERELIVQEGLQRAAIEEQFTRKLCMYCKTCEQGLKRLQA